MNIIIAMTCNRLITGAELELAAVDAVIEPIINGCWFYLLDKGYTGAMNDKRHNI